MKSFITALLCVAVFCLNPDPLNAESALLLEDVPKWNVGDSWKYRTEKSLDRTVTQGAGLFAVSMKLSRVESTMTFTVTGTANAEGEDCYVVSVQGNQRLIGTYSMMQMQGETAGGSLAQISTIEGTECRRISDLAFVRAELRSTGTVELGGSLGGAPTPFTSHSITVASPPVRVLEFPLVEGKSWNVSSVLNTTTSGTSSDSVIDTFNYQCTVIGSETVTLENAAEYECVVISQDGTQTTQSQNAGINIEDVKGNLFFAPSVGNRVRDDAESEELLEYAPAGKSIDLPPATPQAPSIEQT